MHAFEPQCSYWTLILRTLVSLDFEKLAPNKSPNEKWWFFGWFWSSVCKSPSLTWSSTHREVIMAKIKSMRQLQNFVSIITHKRWTWLSQGECQQINNMLTGRHLHPWNQIYGSASLNRQNCTSIVQTGIAIIHTTVITIVTDLMSTTFKSSTKSFKEL